MRKVLERKGEEEEKKGQRGRVSESWNRVLRVVPLGKY